MVRCQSSSSALTDQRSRLEAAQVEPDPLSVVRDAAVCFVASDADRGIPLAEYAVMSGREGHVECHSEGCWRMGVAASE